MDYSKIRVEELAKMENWNSKFESVCFGAGLVTLQDFINHWKKYGTFLNLQYCGPNHEVAFSKLCIRYALLPLLNDQGLTKEAQMPLLVKKLEAVKKVMLCQLIALVTNKYTSRIKKTLDEQIQEIQTEGLLGLLYGIDIEVLPPTLLTLKSLVTGFIVLLIGENDRDKTAAQSSLSFFYSRQGARKELFNPIEVVGNGSKIKLFKLSDLLIKSGVLFDQDEQDLIQFFFDSRDLENNHSHSFKAFTPGVIHRYSKVLQKIQTYFYCFSFLGMDDILRYQLDPGADILILNENTGGIIQALDGVHLPLIIYENIIAGFLKSSYCLLTGLSSEFNGNAFETNRKWVASYLVKKELVAIFDFAAFFRYMESIITSGRDEIEIINFAKITKSYFITGSRYEFLQIKTVCWIIIENEFKLSKDAMENIVLLPSISKRVHKPFKPLRPGTSNKVLKPSDRALKRDAIIKLLERIEIPTTLDYMRKELDAEYPGLNENSIRMLLTSFPKDFFNFSGSGTFGLTVWIQSNKFFKSASLRSLIVEFLKTSLLPKHLDDIEAQIKPFRMITRDDLLSAMRLYGGKIFTLLKDDFVELNLVRYQPTRCVLKRTIVRILDKAGMPASSNYILMALKKRFPTSIITHDSITKIIYFNKKVFFHVNRHCTYGLKKWKQFNRKFEKRTINALVIECLNQAKEPVPFDAVLKHIFQYRLITAEELRENIILKGGVTIGFRDSDFVGFKKKKLYPDGNGDLTYKTYKQKDKKNAVVDLLKSVEMPATLRYISQELERQYPGRKIKSLKGFLTKYRKEIFIISNSTAYGLTSWKKSKNIFRQETLRTLIVECLQQSGSAMHLDEIEDYLLQYRMITREDLVDCLNKNSGGIFVFLNNNVVGLIDKGNQRSLRMTLKKSLIKTLGSMGVPATISFLKKTLQKQNHGTEYTVLSLRFNLKDQKDFFNIKRTSTYGLAIWKQYNKDIKTGSHLDLIIEYLQQSTTPKSVDDIENHLKQYRMLTRDELMASLNTKGGKKLTFLEGDQVYLKMNMDEYHEKMMVKDRVFTVLDTIGKPSSINAIMEELSILYPDFKTTKNSVRDLLVTNKDVFQRFVGQNMYGLWIWGLPENLFKGRSLLWMAINCLRLMKKPLPLEEVLAYIRQFRMVTSGELKEVIIRRGGNKIDFLNETIVVLKNKKYTELDRGLPQLMEI